MKAAKTGFSLRLLLQEWGGGPGQPEPSVPQAKAGDSLRAGALKNSPRGHGGFAEDRVPIGEADSPALQDRQRWCGLGHGAHRGEARPPGGGRRGWEHPRVFALPGPCGDGSGWVRMCVSKGREGFITAGVKRNRSEWGPAIGFGQQHAVNSPATWRVVRSWAPPPGVGLEQRSGQQPHWGLIRSQGSGPRRESGG